MHCPNCGQTAQPGLARCGHCNFKLPETAHPTAAPEGGKINCWNCTHPNDAHAIRCEQCNAKQDKKPVVRRPAEQALRALTFTPNTSSHDE
ncbi:MAG: zinc ribbon domain-containing protein [Lewinellaceae bacterium]|jgi:hypothetical protein|nr:zinc ribbon domain-containing protein [Lewinellaceae bacterium]